MPSAGLVVSRWCALVLLLLPLVFQGAHAQEWPQQGKTLRILNPFPPGGTSDTLSRIIAAKLTTQLGIPVVVENKPGGSTVVAVVELRRSPPDGYTVLYTVTGTTSQLPHLYAKPPFDPFTDFTPLGVIAYNQLILTAPANAPFNTVGELISYARANPGKLNYGSFGNGSFPHIATEQLKKAAGVFITHIPYKGGGDAARAVMGGEVDLLFDAPVTAIANARGGRVKMLAIAGPKRIPSIEQVPTMAEAGVKGMDLQGLEQLLGPRGMPKALADKVNTEFMKAARSPEAMELYTRGGFDFIASTPEEHLRIMRQNSDQWGEVIRRTGIKLD
jgi:tripartite-type tricarboxylate transporter receptor subunit TctC